MFKSVMFLNTKKYDGINPQLNLEANLSNTFGWKLPKWTKIYYNVA